MKSVFSVQRSASRVRSSKGTTERQFPINHSPLTIRAARPRERGIALVITLGVLTVILLIAVAFALSARTEARSGSSYDMLVTSKAMAKMGLDRCVMEGRRLGDNKPFSGGNTAIYSTNDLTQYDGSWMTDSNPVHTIEGDYVDINENGERDSTEPYWIAVRDDGGKVVGRFAYTIVGDPTAGTNAASSVVDINGIGSYTNVGGFDTYVRGMGFIGDTNGGYTIGVAGDVNLVSFLEKLGYTDPDESARKILAFRYGYDGGTTAPPQGVYYPGVDNTDDNLIWGINDHAEYNPSAPLDNDDRIKDVGTDMPNIDADPALSNLVLYAIDGSSAGDDNKKSYYLGNRLNLNTNAASTVADIASFVTMLQNALPANDLDQLGQWAANIFDFTSTGPIPSTFTGGVSGTTVFFGTKRIPYFNQLRNKFTLNLALSGANAQVNLNAGGVANFPSELWNPYPVTYNSTVSVIITNTISFSSNPAIAQLVPLTYVVTNTFSTSIPPGFKQCDGPFGGFPAGSAALSASFPTNSLLPTGSAQLIVSNTFTFTVYRGTLPSTQVISRGSGETCPSQTVVISNGMANVNIFLNAEADDPRICYLFPQPIDTGAFWFSLPADPNPTSTKGTNVYAWQTYGGPNGLVALPATTNREGLASFATNKMGSAFMNIADIGYVYRGEPFHGSNAVGAWQTIRLQPGGEGAVLDYVRVNELSGVRGRININADTNGLNGAPLQSPALWALFDGITVTGYGALNSNKIENIISELGEYRASLPPTVLNGVTNIVFTNIGQVCELETLVTDNSGGMIPFTNDVAREYIIRSIANLITVSPDSAQELIAWGQSFRGTVPSGIIQIRAGTEGGSGSQIKLRKFRYIQH